MLTKSNDNDGDGLGAITDGAGYVALSGGRRRGLGAPRAPPRPRLHAHLRRHLRPHQWMLPHRTTPRTGYTNGPSPLWPPSLPAQSQRRALENGSLHDSKSCVPVEAAAKLKRMARMEPRYERNLPKLCSFFARGECDRR